MGGGTEEEFTNSYQELGPEIALKMGYHLMALWEAQAFARWGRDGTKKSCSCVYVGGQGERVFQEDIQKLETSGCVSNFVSSLVLLSRRNAGGAVGCARWRLLYRT